ncbi:FTR1 family protein [Dasania marina]|uniref:FTR1 family protein n=1 Tax=Dasania marina TaxID=471499 RepID=UPI000366DDF1|nr:FTR1 family protein [Dasania marina]
MLINSVALILEETLEAALLISMLLAMTGPWLKSKAWLLYSFLLGFFVAYCYARAMADISEWFNYAGQEVLNAFLQAMIALLLMLLSWQLYSAATAINPGALMVCCASAVVFSICREGAEIILYLKGFSSNHEAYPAVMIGSGLGFGIGISVGVLLYYGLINVSAHYRSRVYGVLLAIFSGNMLSQATLQLTQADWLPAAHPMWDSSYWVAEHSITGHILYSLIGYEATPSGLQIVAYASGMLSVFLITMLARRRAQGMVCL